MLTAKTTFASASVDNLQKAREFYVDTLHFTLVDESMGLNLELPGGLHLYLYEKENHQPATFTILNFVVDSIDDTVYHLGEEHHIAMERYDTLPAEQDQLGILRGKASGDGPDIAWFKDPAGNILSIIEE